VFAAASAHGVGQVGGQGKDDGATSATGRGPHGCRVDPWAAVRGVIESGRSSVGGV
jgi:hypothetical protein